MEEEGNSWLRRAKLSHTVYERSSSTRETCNPLSAQAKRELAFNTKRLNLESKSLNFNLDAPSIVLAKKSIRDSQSLKLDASSLELKPKMSRSELKAKGSSLGSTLMPNSQSTLKSKTLNVDSLSSPNSEPKPKPKPKRSALDTTNLCFYPNEATCLSSKWSDSTATPSLSGKLDHDSRKSGNFPFRPDAGSTWSDSNMVPTPSLKVKLDQTSCSSSMPNNIVETNSKLKRRSASPLPTTTISDVFKEAKSIGKRFSTPPPSRKASHSRAETSPMKRLSSLRAAEESKKKDPSWAKHRVGGRVPAVDPTDEWMVDLSKLYLGLRFASGAHSRLYHGMYKDRPVAVKITQQPDDDENGVMAARLEKEFFSEVTLLSHLCHRNVIKNTRPVIPMDCPAALRALMEQCWASHREKRPEFWQIVKVLEQFESALARDGTLDQFPNLMCQDPKNRLVHWIQKLKPSLAEGTGPPNPKLL